VWPGREGAEQHKNEQYYKNSSYHEENIMANPIRRYQVFTEPIKNPAVMSFVLQSAQNEGKSGPAINSIAGKIVARI
jgi:hypothetical protein